MRKEHVVIGSTYVVKNSPSWSNRNSFIDVTFKTNSYAIFSPQIVDGNCPREHRTALLTKQVCLDKEKLEALKKDVVELILKVVKQEKQLLLLQKYKTDDEELAYVLSEIVKTGGDEKKILEMIISKKSKIAGSIKTHIKGLDLQSMLNETLKVSQ